jgi:hypothetical protein
MSLPNVDLENDAATRLNEMDGIFLENLSVDMKRKSRPWLALCTERGL